MVLTNGTGRLADDFWLMAHDELTGRARVAQRILGLGVAGALLGELAMSERVGVRDGCVVVLDSRAPGDAVAGVVLGYLAAEGRARPVRDWLVFLGESAAERVGARLSGAGLLVAHPSRVPLRADRLVPADTQSAVMPLVNLCTKAMRGRPVDASGAMLAGLAQATGLDHPGLWEVRNTPRAARFLSETLAVLSPASLRELIRHTEAAVAGAITSHV